MERVTAVFEAFEHRDVPYCLLRNFDFLSGGAVRGDIDVLLPSEERSTVSGLLTDAGWRRQPGDTSRQTQYRRYVSELGMTTLDVYWDDPTYNGLPVVDGGRMLTNRRRYEGHWVPGPNEYVVELTFHSVLNKGRFREYYRDEIERFRPEIDRESVKQQAYSLYGSPGVRTILDTLDGEYQTAISRKWRLVARRLQTNPTESGTLCYNLTAYRDVAKPLQKRVGVLSQDQRQPVIAFIGPDGVGKSTVIEELSNRLERQGATVTVEKMGVYSGRTPIQTAWRLASNAVRNRREGNTAEAADRQNRDMPDRHPLWKSLALLSDNAIRHGLVRTQPGDVVIADRFPHEILAYGKLGPFEPILRLFELPPFDGFVLRDDPARVAGRSDLSERAVRTFFDRLEPVDWPRIDVSSGVDQAVDQVLDIFGADYSYS